ncbi:MAG: hypothetical protein ABJP63_03150 [Hyphomicrobiales bacterium]
MTDVDIKLPEFSDTHAVVTAIEDVCAKEALIVSMKSTLKKYPGCIHWHFKRHNERGVLELTWWPCSEAMKPARLWLSAHSNRKAEWMQRLMPRLKTLIEEALAVQGQRS